MSPFGTVFALLVAAAAAASVAGVAPRRAGHRGRANGREILAVTAREVLAGAQFKVRSHRVFSVTSSASSYEGEILNWGQRIIAVVLVHCPSYAHGYCRLSMMSAMCCYGYDYE